MSNSLRKVTLLALFDREVEDTGMFRNVGNCFIGIHVVLTLQEDVCLYQDASEHHTCRNFPAVL
jgi:hypothetical protein